MGRQGAGSSKQVQFRGELTGLLEGWSLFSTFPSPPWHSANSTFSGFHLIRANFFREHSWIFPISSSIQVRGEKGQLERKDPNCSNSYQ